MAQAKLSVRNAVYGGISLGDTFCWEDRKLPATSEDALVAIRDLAKPCAFHVIMLPKTFLNDTQLLHVVQPGGWLAMLAGQYIIFCDSNYRG
jgi:hypothetical protein